MKRDGRTSFHGIHVSWEMIQSLIPHKLVIRSLQVCMEFMQSFCSIFLMYYSIDIFHLFITDGMAEGSSKHRFTGC